MGEKARGKMYKTEGFGAKLPGPACEGEKLPGQVGKVSEGEAGVETRQCQVVV